MVIEIPEALVVEREVLNNFNLSFNKTIRFWIDGGGSNMINALGGQKFGKGFR